MTPAKLWLCIVRVVGLVVRKPGVIGCKKFLSSFAATIQEPSQNVPTLPYTSFIGISTQSVSSAIINIIHASLFSLAIVSFPYSIPTLNTQRPVRV